MVLAKMFVLSMIRYGRGGDDPACLVYGSPKQPTPVVLAQRYESAEAGAGYAHRTGKASTVFTMTGLPRATRATTTATATATTPTCNSGVGGRAWV